MPTVSYPFDTTGVAVTNLVENELHTVTEANAAPYRILIPYNAPFYLHNLKIEHINALGEARELFEGVDYYATLPYVAAARATGRAVYGGIALINSLVQGTVRFTSYQTVGGEWVANRDYVYEQLLASQYNPRTTWWDKITNVQQIFPPVDHQDSIWNVQGHVEVLAALEQIRAAILASPNQTGAFAAHLVMSGNVHGMSAADIGLGNIENLPMATDQEVMEKAPVDKYVTLRQIVMLLNPVVPA